MTTLEQAEDNTGYMQDFHKLAAGEQTILEQVAGIIHASTAIACTDCRYCTPECPRNIDIPDYFGLYNNMKRRQSLKPVMGLWWAVPYITLLQMPRWLRS